MPQFRDGPGGHVRQIDEIPLEDALRPEPGGIDLIPRNLRELFRNEPELRERTSISGIYQLLLQNPSAFGARWRSRG